MKNLVLNGHAVHVDDDGFISLTDMWKASGSNPRHKPSLFTSNATTKKFIDSLNLKVGIPTFKILKGRQGGTWGHKLLAYKFASWIDPVFEVGAYSVLDSFFSGKLVQTRTEAMFNLLEDEERSENKGSFHGRGLNRRKREKGKLNERRKKLLSDIQPELGLDD